MHAISSLSDSPGAGRLGRACLAVALALCLARPGPVRAGDETGAGVPRPFRMAMSSCLLHDVSENDAKAAVKAWTQALEEQSGARIDATPRILRGAPAFLSAFQNDEVDSATMAIDEFLSLSTAMPCTDLICEQRPQLGNIYMVLVPKDSPARGLKDLKGRRLLALDSLPGMVLAERWLDVELARGGLPRAADHFSDIIPKKKLSLAVLPVFFRTADACLITHRGLDAMTELNPQVGEQLRPIAVSPSFVTAICFFSARCASPDKPKILNAILHFHESPRGQQILMLFQSGALAPLADSDLDSVRQLLAEHRRLFESPREPSPQTLNAPNFPPQDPRFMLSRTNLP